MYLSVSIAGNNHNLVVWVVDEPSSDIQDYFCEQLLAQSYAFDLTKRQACRPCNRSVDQISHS